VGSLLSDGHHLIIRSVTGELRWGYRRAAQLCDLTFERYASPTWTLTAKVTTQDEYAVSQRPLVCVLPDRRWQFDVLTLQINDRLLTASLRAQV